jgi:acyl-CoA reductase-like NAD-dependent aldehyde dehydrogenase
VNTLTSLFPLQEEIPAELRLLSPIHQRAYLVDGEIRIWKGSARKVISPVRLRQADGTLTPLEIGSQPHMGRDEALAALDGAVRAYDHGGGVWPTMLVAERIACLEHFIRLICVKRREIVQLILWEIGKSLADSEKEFDRTIEYMRATIDAVKEVDNSNSRFVEQEGVIAQIRRAPLGVVLCMGPFNYPMNETFTTMIPALVMGNTVVFKPPTHGTLLFYPMLEAFREAFPAGVVNTVYGPGEAVIPPIMETGKINVLAFIGSSGVADTLKKQHPKSNRLRGVLALDAKNAAIILPDADLELTVRECLLGTLSFNGQRCTALKMLLVHQSIAEAFLRRLAEELDKVRIGMPWENGVQITPLAEEGAPAYLAECIADAVSHGARVINAGGGESSASLFRPALVFPVSQEMRLYNEEQFGPVIPVMPFEDIQTALDYVIESDYGQQVSIFGSNPSQIAALIDPLVNQVCRVNINAQCQRGPDTFPFTGRKDSAEGTLSVTDALRSFSIRSMVAAKRCETTTHLLDDIVVNRRSKFLNTGFVF